MTSAGRTKAQNAEAPKSPVAITSMDIVEKADLAALSEQLRAAGASDTRVREVVWGILQWRFRDAQSEKRLARLQHGWWLDDRRTMGVTSPRQLKADDLGLSRELVEDKFAALLGEDPAQLEVVKARYSFLPEDLQNKLAKLNRDLEIEWVPTGDPEADARIQAEMAKNKARNSAEKEKLIASLPADQRREYEMRYGDAGMELSSGIRTVPGATEEEFRKLYSITAASGVSTGENITTGSGTIRLLSDINPQTQQALTERVVSELGFDRALDFLWAGTPEFRAAATVSKEAGLAPTTAGRYAQLAAETGMKAAAINQDASLTFEERRAALVALQQTARAEIDALIPPAAQQKLAPNALAWVNQMSDGRYKMMAPGFPGRGSSSRTMTVSATAPNSAAVLMAPPPVRPRSN
jgi:hypothetical protein